MLLSILSMNFAHAYSADCSTDDGKSFYMSVENQVLTVNNKYSHSYDGKDYSGWYSYSNSRYTYQTGKFQNGWFPIKVRNSAGQWNIGSCNFR